MNGTCRFDDFLQVRICCVRVLCLVYRHFCYHYCARLYLHQNHYFLHIGATTCRSNGSLQLPLLDVPMLSHASSLLLSLMHETLPSSTSFTYRDRHVQFSWILAASFTLYSHVVSVSNAPSLLPSVLYEVRPSSTSLIQGPPRAGLILAVSFTFYSHVVSLSYASSLLPSLLHEALPSQSLLICIQGPPRAGLMDPCSFPYLMFCCLIITTMITATDSNLTISLLIYLLPRHGLMESCTFLIFLYSRVFLFIPYLMFLRFHFSPLLPSPLLPS